MLFDLLSTDVYVSYNVDLAHIIGLQGAVYISELININRKAIKKQKLIDNYFVVDRKYIEQRTTLKEQEQLELDKCLARIDLIIIGEDKNHLQVNMDALTGIMLEPNKTIVAEASSVIKRGKPSKKESIVKNLKSNIVTTNAELQEAYCNWIDAVMAKQGWMSKEAVIEGQKIIDEFTSRDLDLALDVLKTASICGYRDMTWAIQAYKSRPVKATFKEDTVKPCISSKSQLADEVF